MRLETATWVPGSYSIRTGARDIFKLRGEDLDSGKQLSIRREGWQAFAVESRRGAVRGAVQLSAYDSPSSEAFGVVESSYALLPSSRYLHCPDMEGECRVIYVCEFVSRAPRHWRRALKAVVRI
jgi:predicted metalloprotease with PDZ domain